MIDVVKPRLLKNPSGTIGSSCFDSQMTNTTISAMPPISGTSVLGDIHGCVLVPIRA